MPTAINTEAAPCQMRRMACLRLEKARRSYLSSRANCSAASMRSSVEASPKNRILAYNPARILRIRTRSRCASAASRANSPILSSATGSRQQPRQHLDVIAEVRGRFQCRSPGHGGAHSAVMWLGRPQYAGRCSSWHYCGWPRSFVPNVMALVLYLPELRLDNA